MNVITRFAPSPTGFLHMGGVRTAFALRIEDTDKARNKTEWETALIDDLSWLGLKHDTFSRQSDRIEIYSKYIQKLIINGSAYISKEIPKEEGQRHEVIRFKNPNKVVVINDLIRGEVRVDTTDLGDFVIARSFTEPVFHLAVVVDDFEMGITHVIRAEEHLSNTPRQILILEALGAPRPVYAHLPLVLAPDKSKLSKRKHGETVSLTYYRNKGYLPESIINFVALMGWNPGTDQELFSLDELIAKFKLEKVQKGGAIFNINKLNWINREYIRKLSNHSFADHIVPFIPEWLKTNDGLFIKLLPLLRKKINAFGDLAAILSQEGELGFVKDLKSYEPDILRWKKNPDFQITQRHLLAVKKLLENLGKGDWQVPKLTTSLWPYALEHGKGDVLWPLRVALTGQERSPDPFTCANLLGKEETIRRIDIACQKILTIHPTNQ